MKQKIIATTFIVIGLTGVFFLGRETSDKKLGAEVLAQEVILEDGENYKVLRTGDEAYSRYNAETDRRTKKSLQDRNAQLQAEIQQNLDEIAEINARLLKFQQETNKR